MKISMKSILVFAVMISFAAGASFAEEKKTGEKSTLPCTATSGSKKEVKSESASEDKKDDSKVGTGK